jgi:hypothetical protein
MGLLMKSECEKCDAPLPLDAADARICSYECTFCATCAATMGDAARTAAGSSRRGPRRDHVLEVPPASPVPENRHRR